MESGLVSEYDARLLLVEGVDDRVVVGGGDARAVDAQAVDVVVGPLLLDGVAHQDGVGGFVLGFELGLDVEGAFGTLLGQRFLHFLCNISS